MMWTYTVRLIDRVPLGSCLTRVSFAFLSAGPVRTSPVGLRPISESPTTSSSSGSRSADMKRSIASPLSFGVRSRLRVRNGTSSPNQMPLTPHTSRGQVIAPTPGGSGGGNTNFAQCPGTAASGLPAAAILDSGAPDELCSSPSIGSHALVEASAPATRQTPGDVHVRIGRNLLQCSFR